MNVNSLKQMVHGKTHIRHDNMIYHRDEKMINLFLRGNNHPEMSGDDVYAHEYNLQVKK
jgi:hypothetical protein